MSLHLLHLPLEILLASASELSDRDLHSLRLVCRQLNQVAFDLVGPREFNFVNINLRYTGLQRLHGISKAVHINRCVKHLCIVDGRYSDKDTAQYFETEKAVRDICQGDNRLKLQTLELHHVNLTQIALLDLLFSNRDSLHTFDITGSEISNGGKWRRVFADMVGNFPQLRAIKVDFPYEYENDKLTIVQFTKLIKYPCPLGSENYSFHTKELSIERRQLDTLLHPIDIKYYHRPLKVSVHMVSYSGPDIDQFLLVLADEAQSQ